MEEKEDHLLESLLERGEEYGKTTLKLLKLKALDKSVGMASLILFYAVITLILFMFLLMVTIGVAIWLGEITGKSWYGFFAVAGIYGILAVVLYLFMGKWIRKVAGNFIITHMLK
jgi:hypothetical protein